MLLNLFQITTPPPREQIMPIIMLAVFIPIGIILLKISLAITKAERKTQFKWVAASYGIQFGITFAISSPLLLWGMIGAFEGDIGAIIAVSILCAFVNLNIINILHKIGLKRALVVGLITVGPLIYVMYNLGSLIPHLASMVMV